MPLKLTVSNGDIAQVINQFGGFYKDPLSKRPYEDNEWDAYRHIYSSAAYTEKFGSSIAQFLGNLNEIFPVSKWGKSHDSAYYDRENMDYWNNKVGRTEYQKWKDAKDLGDTEKSLEKWLYDVVKEGKTINDLSDTRKWSYPYIDIFEEQLADDINWFNSQEIIKSIKDTLLNSGESILNFVITPSFGGSDKLIINDNKLVIFTENEGKIIVDDFTSGNLSIVSPINSTDISTTKNILGDLAYKDFDSDRSGIQTRTDDLGNIIQIPDQEKEQKDKLFGSEQSDLIQSGALNDRVMGKGGDDIIEGGAGTDILAGENGNDRLYADSQADTKSLFNSDNTPVGSTHDWLAGGDGDDQLFGSSGSNGLSGGAGNKSSWLTP